jgi:hypothetical protein
MTIPAEFRPSITIAIPAILNFLKDGDGDVCREGAAAVSTLSGQGETTNLPV